MTDNKSKFGVGYMIPPVEGQFKKGRSGNPTGRPKGAKNLRTVVKEAASKKVTVVEDGKRTRKSKLDLLVAQMFNKAAKGEARFAQMALEQVRNIENPSVTHSANIVIEEADKPVIAQIIARIRRATE
jgi:uncharacterized membrane protein